MVSNLAELTRTLRRSGGTDRSEGDIAEFRSRVTADRDQIQADLRRNGEATFTDNQGNRFLIKRRIGNR